VVDQGVDRFEPDVEGGNVGDDCNEVRELQQVLVVPGVQRRLAQR
jgi:hypothetical protein